MHFGRLEIFQPDGPVEIFFIEKGVIAIGRSSGNDLVLDRNGVSRYHATLSNKDHQTFIEDLESVNGTYVDGLKIPPGESRLLRGGEEIQIGDARLVFYPPEDVGDTTIVARSQREEKTSFAVEMEGPYIPVAPGSHTQIILKLRNTDEQQTETFFIAVKGVPKEWVRINRPQVEIEPDSDAEVTIIFKPLRKSETAPGEYIIKVSVYPKQAPEDVVEMEGLLRILAYGGYGVAMRTRTVEGNDSFQMVVHNQGNAALTVSFSGRSKDRPFVFEFATPTIKLGPGERRTISGHLQPKQRTLFGKPEEYTFEILSQSHDASQFVAPISAKYIHRPLLPVWSLVVSGVGMLLATVLLVTFAVIVLAGDDENDGGATAPPLPPPIITRFELEAALPLVIEEPFEVVWAVQNAETKTLDVEHEDELVTQYSLPVTNAGSYPVSLQTAGVYTLVLRASNDEEEAQQSLTVEVQPRLTFSYELPLVNLPGTDGPIPQPYLYRNVQEQAVTIVWDVDWTRAPAESELSPPTMILELPHLNIERLLSDSDPEMLQIPVFLRDPALASIAATLNSVGPDEVEASASLSIPVDYPVCVPTRSTVEAYSGPALGYASLGSFVFESEESVQVDLRDASGEWLRVLRVPLEASDTAVNSWVMSTDLDCGFDVTLLAEAQVTDYPPLPSDEVNGGVNETENSIPATTATPAPRG